MPARQLAQAAGRVARLQAATRRGFGSKFNAGFFIGSSCSAAAECQDGTFAKLASLTGQEDAFAKYKALVSEDKDALAKIAWLLGHDEETFAKLREFVCLLQKASLDGVDLDALMSVLESIEPQSQGQLERLRAVQRLMEELERVQRVLQDVFGHVDLMDIDPLVLPYRLLEHHRLRTPAWKAERHREHRGMMNLSLAEDAALLAELLEHCAMAECVYKRTEESVRQRLTDIWGDTWDMPALVTVAQPGRPAHFVAVRPPRPEVTDGGRVVLAIRGTKELADVLTDALLDSSPLGCGGQGHSGAVRAARDLCDAYGSLLRDYEGRGYDVVVVGHSLGAATSAAVTVRLRQELGLQRARCICFAPPATVDVKTAQECSAYITSVVHDDDFIPRSQVASLLRLYKELKEFDYVPLAKADIRERLTVIPESLLSFLPLSEILAKVDAALDGRATERWERQRASENLENNSEQLSTKFDALPLLHVPGFVVHLYRSDAAAGYGAARVGPEYLEHLELSSTMITDHLLKSYLEALQCLEAAAKKKVDEDVEHAQSYLPLGTTPGKAVVAAGVQLSHRVKNKLVAAIESRPDTS